MKHTILFFITIFTLNGYAQISYEPGYFINNEDQKTNCFIKNMDWKNNPTSFEYKLSETTIESNTATIETVKEFSITNSVKYNRFVVNIDRSREIIKYMSEERAPSFNEEILFLKLIVEGTANLYSYEDSNLGRYFFNIDSPNTNPEQLIFKSYLDSEDEGEYKNIIRTNNAYKQQLLNNLNCSSISQKDIKNTNYKERELKKIFENYNKCKDPNYESFSIKRPKKDLFNFSARLGLSATSLKIQNMPIPSWDTNFDSKLTLRIGVETEFILPFNKNKWSLIVQPTYQSFKSEKEITYLQTSLVTKKTIVYVNYKSLEFPIGVRYYSFLNADSKLFFNLSAIIDMPMSSSISADRAEGTELFDLDISSKPSFALGAGYNYHSKYTLELTLLTSRKILNNHPSWNTNYNNLALTFGYVFN
ncbi:tRNA modification GTPase [Lacinutrix neustonica]|uniref:tRNA modification GTPase n=1 Tax=Lacinutrix neustonica TaxID=2980107 RepID=A0A9E8SCD0_9FLAO|nr:tRNA modification GTPase [Lacinutrix neustonica]WAC00876.1 tRNA modification GTPase [Lacinutrix neustonica]